MITEIRMPQKGLTEESALLSEWHVKKGDVVKAGDYLFAIENGKATFEIETEVAGTVLATYGEEGDEIPIKTVVCVIGEPGDSVEKPKAKEEPEEELPKEDTAEKDSVFVSPRARNLAQKHHLDLAQIPGTGPGGRIIERDVLRAAENPSAVKMDEDRPVQVTIPVKIERATFDQERTVEMKEAESAEYRTVPHTSMRKAIAKNMHNSLATMAQLSHMASFDASAILALRAKLKANASSMNLPNVTINDLICYGVAKTLMDYDYMNAHYNDQEMKIFRHVHLGVAVDTERGLLVPTVRNADQLTLSELASENKRLSTACREGKATGQELTGGTFTVSNIGAYGVEYFTPVINPPQVAILGVGGVTDRVRVVDGQITAYKSIGLSLTYDHRALDGVAASKFLQALCRNLEQFELLLMK